MCIRDSHHTATASDGDVVEYQVISTLPTITSPATALTTYTFVDNLSKGIQYNKGDVKIEFFKDAAFTDRAAVWTEQDGKFTASYRGTPVEILDQLRMEADRGIPNVAEYIRFPAERLARAGIEGRPVQPDP